MKLPLSFQILYRKDVSRTQTHLQVKIFDKLFFFVVQKREKSVDVYDARNEFLHNFPSPEGFYPVKAIAIRIGHFYNHNMFPPHKLSYHYHRMKNEL